MRYWLMKSEPDEASIDDLANAEQRTLPWTGVRNYQARNFMRDLFEVGQRVLFYHSNAEPPAVMGVAEVVRAGYPDNTALDPNSKYFDPEAKKKGESPWIMVDIRATHRFENPVDRDQLRNEPALKNMMVLRRGARLSVQPVSRAEFEKICALGKLRAV